MDTTLHQILSNPVIVRNWIWIILQLAGFITIVFAIRQFAISRRAHLLDVYLRLLAFLDTEKMRAARSYVYAIKGHPQGRMVFETEHWLDLEKHKDKPEYQDWVQHHEWAEMVARSFDQLGLLIREGIVPLNLLARFYTPPAIKCWYYLSKYIDAQRRYRDQPGHMWEWEHLVMDVIIKGLRKNKGLWEDQADHDKLSVFVQEIRSELPDMLSDEKYKQPQFLWILRRRAWFWERQSRWQ